MHQIDAETREELAMQNCPYCKADKPVRVLEHTGEYVHDLGGPVNGTRHQGGVILCLSNGLRGGPHLTRT
jgi:hypothetical protein